MDKALNLCVIAVSAIWFALRLMAGESHAATVTFGAAKDNSIFQNNASNTSGGSAGMFSGTNGMGSPRCGLIAFDIAGGESGRPASSHVEAFDIAARGLLHITAHAGEAAGPESIADALAECHAERLGHGTRLGESPSLRDYVRDRRIGIEINITSNVQTRVVTAPSAHPVRDFYDRGLNVTLCTDSWLMCGTTLTNEYLLAHTELGFTRPEIDRMILNGFESAFVEWPIRERLIASARRELAAL